MANQRKIFENIYSQYIEKIYRFVFLKVNSQEKAEDISSEVFLRFWKYLNKDAKIDNTQAFLYKIANNLVIDHYREKGQAQFVSTQNYAIVDSETDLETQSLLTSDMNNVKNALGNIKKNYQNIIIWRYLDELTIPEIAKIMDKSEEAVRVMLHRAMKALKAELE